jgi:hypothetical protein
MVMNVVFAPAASGFPRSNFSDGDHMKKDECPPETQRPPQNCDDVREMAHSNALRRGYANTNGDSIPDVMQKPYSTVKDDNVNHNDCSTGNAHMACMFNDPCTEQHGTLMGLRSNSARHATTYFQRKDGTGFECDFTPKRDGSSPSGYDGIFIAGRADTRIGTAFPDAGEFMDPQYQRDGCEMNGATTSSFNGGGGLFGGGNAIQDMMMLAAIMQLLQGQQNQNNVPPPYNDVIIPTPTPTATPEPIDDTTSQGDARISSTEMSDAAIVAPVVVESEDSRSTRTRRLSDGDDSEEAGVSEGVQKAEWEENREGIF